MPVVLGVVEPAVVEVAAEVVGACSEAVVGAAIAVGVDGVVGVTVFEPAALSCTEELTCVEPAVLLVVDEAAVLVWAVSEPVVLVLTAAGVAFCDFEEAVVLLPPVEDR